MTKILMCCSTLSTKGGMVSVVKNYLNYNEWEEYDIKYVPTHFDGNKVLMMLHFMCRYFQILYLAIFGNYSIAHLHTAERGSFWRKALLSKSLKLLGLKVIMHHHGAEFEQFYSNASEKQKTRICKTLNLVDVNIVLSKSLINMILSKAPSAHVEVLYNAVPTYDKNMYNKSAMNVLFLGRLGQRKGAYDLLECIKQIDGRIPSEVKFYLCGDGEIDEVNKRVESMGIGHRIAHVGWIDAAQKKEIFANTMINVLPSYNEGLPMTILETMAYGIPNVSTRIASIPEVIHDGETGYIIEPGDKEKLSAILIKLICERELRESISSNSYEFITRYFDFASHSKMLKQIYQHLI